MKLHGLPLSNYYNMAKHAVLQKGIVCEFVNTRPSQDPDYLLKSPLGKVPLLETPHGFLSETDAILDYLDEGFAGPKLFPEDAFARAKVRQLMKVQELYIEGSGPFTSPLVTRVIGITPSGATQCVLELELEDGARLHVPIIHKAARTLTKLLMVQASRVPAADPTA